MSSYLTLRKNKNWVIYWNRNTEMYNLWWENLPTSNGEWCQFGMESLDMLKGYLFADLRKRNEYLETCEKVYDDLLKSQAPLSHIQEQAGEVANAKEFRDDLLPVKYQLEMLEMMVEQSGNSDIWEWSIS